MSGSRARTSNSVSLFPFLAVLVCAMGALIFLLIVTTRRIRSEALARAVAAREELQTQAPSIRPTLAQPEYAPVVAPRIVMQEPSIIRELEPPAKPQRIEPIPGLIDLGIAQTRPVLPPKKVLPPPPPPPEPKPIWPAAIAQKTAPPDPNIPLKEQLAKLQAARKAWWDAVQKKQEAASSLKQKVDRLTADLKKTNSQIEAVAKQRLEDSKTERELQQTRAELLGQLAKVQQQIEDTQQLAQAAPTKFQVVPFDGQTGTNYRPIIIECTAAGMRFQPEGVLLTESDFDGFTLGKNPLLAGAQTLSDYWLKVSARSGGKEPGPYVLLIVRPSGAKYYAARQLLEALDRPFGYELVEENLPLDIPPIDPIAAELCKNAVESTLKERDDLKRLLATHGPDMLGRNPQVRVIKKPGGGFDVEYAPKGPFDGAGFGESDDSSSDGFPATDRYGKPYRDVPGYETGSSQNSQPDRTGTSTGSSNETGSGELVKRPSGAMPGVGQFGSSNFQNALPNSSGNGTGGTLTDPREPGRLPDDVIRRSRGNVPYRPDEDGTNPPSNEIVNVPAPSSAEPNPTAGSVQDDPGRAPNSAGESREGGTEYPLANNSQNTSNNGASSSSTTNVSPTKPESPQTGTASPNANSAQQPPLGTPTPPSAAGGGSGQPAEPSSAYEPAMPNFLSLNSRRSLERTEPYQRRWGFSDPRASIGFEREITIRVEPNRLVVGNAFAVSYNANSTPDQLGAGMLEAIERTVRKWGRPPMSFYWVPTLQFEVGREQVPVYQGLNQTAKSWGLETTAKAIEN